jgi:hypothetical protein
MEKLTVEQAAIVSAFTGVLACDFNDMQEYVEKVMGRPVYTHEFAFNADEIKEATRADFLALVPSERMNQTYVH